MACILDDGQHLSVKIFWLLIVLNHREYCHDKVTTSYNGWSEQEGQKE